MCDNAIEKDVRKPAPDEEARGAVATEAARLARTLLAEGSR
jgi:hypothetical protein